MSLALKEEGIHEENNEPGKEEEKKQIYSQKIITLFL